MSDYTKSYCNDCGFFETVKDTVKETGYCNLRNFLVASYGTCNYFKETKNE
jgi:hypothetical protein